MEYWDGSESSDESDVKADGCLASNRLNAEELQHRLEEVNDQPRDRRARRTPSPSDWDQWVFTTCPPTPSYRRSRFKPSNGLSPTWDMKSSRQPGSVLPGSSIPYSDRPGSAWRRDDPSLRHSLQRDDSAKPTETPPVTQQEAPLPKASDAGSTSRQTGHRRGPDTINGLRTAASAQRRHYDPVPSFGTPGTVIKRGTADSVQTGNDLAKSLFRRTGSTVPNWHDLPPDSNIDPWSREPLQTEEKIPFAALARERNLRRHYQSPSAV